MSAPDLLQSIATNLRKLRAHHGVTREQLGATAEVDPQLIKRIESGRANPALVVLSRLASALMISASLVLSGGEVMAETELSAAVEPFEGEAVGETMASLRKQRNLSRRALAQMAEVQAVTLAKYETATTDARILAIEPIAGALGMGTTDFVRAVELRQRQLGAGRGWQSPSAGVLFRLVASGANSRLWEWRLAPHTAYVEQEPVAVEEIATAIRGRVRVELGDEVHQLHRGGSIVLPPSARPRFENAGTSTARLLRYRSVSD
jgi:transcriptional regulator with XRE-family HTH domain